MRFPRRTLGLLALVAALLTLPTGAARANQAYDRVAAAYNQGGAHLNPCMFTTAELEAALSAIPPAFRTAVPELRRAIEGAIMARKRGECKGVKPNEATTGGAAPGAVPPVTTTPSTPAIAPAATTPTTATAPAATVPAPATTAPAPAATAPAQPVAPGSTGHDRTALIVALIALGTLLLGALGLWGLAQTRGWDPPWVARMRHAWGEAGFRTTSTWAEFTDWLRLGR